MQDLLYLSKNNARLKTNLVFIIDEKNGALEEQIMPKILSNSHIINRENNPTTALIIKGIPAPLRVIVSKKGTLKVENL